MPRTQTDHRQRTAARAHARSVGSPSRRTGARRAVLLLVDGARPDVVQYLLDVGDLPNLARYVVEPGGMVPATTVFPSTTGVAYLPFLTGCYPGTCNVPGIRWLDVAQYGGRWWRDRAAVRSYCGYQAGLLNADLEGSVPCLFDLVPDAVAICTPLERGLPRGRVRSKAARSLWGSLAHYTGRFGPLERAAGRSLCETVAERPSFVFAVFPGVDGATHLRDPWHPAVLDMYRAFDRTVGAYAAAGGLDDDPLVVVVSDHGLSPVTRHTDVAVALEGMGIRTLRHPVVWRRNPMAAVMVSGNGSAHVYLRPGVRRTKRIALDEIESGEVPGISRMLVDRLAALPGIAMVAAVDGVGVTIVSRDGRARVRLVPGGIAYEPRSADVLELGTARTDADRAWHRRTVEARFPDGPAQLLQVFQSARAGDLIVMAAEGTDLRGPWEIPEHRSGHGSLINEHMRCLMVANVPLPGPMRSVDVFPLLLDRLALPIPTGIDALTSHPDERRKVPIPA